MADTARLRTHSLARPVVAQRSAGRRGCGALRGETTGATAGASLSRFRRARGRRATEPGLGRELRASSRCGSARPSEAALECAAAPAMIVIKLGGSLARSCELSDWLAALNE